MHRRMPSTLNLCPAFLVNPFADDIFSGSLQTDPTFSDLYGDQLRRLTQALELTAKAPSGLPLRRGGRALLLSSPVAGAGKSHLLARLRAEQGDRAHFFEISLSDTQEFRWEIWLDRMLRGLHEGDKEKTALTPLAAQTASTLVAGIDYLKSANALTAAPSAGELQWLRDHRSQLFAKSSTPHATVRWFHQHSNDLLPKISRAFAARAGFPEERVHTWLTFLYQYGLHTPVEGSTEAMSGSAAQCHHLRSAPSLTNQAHRLQVRSDLQLLGHLLTLDLPLAPIFDHLDWVYRDQESSLQLTRMILEFGKLVPRSLSIIGMNEDNWQESFVPALPSALLDRLTAQQCRMQGVPRAQWDDFLRRRAESPKATESDILDHLTMELSRTYQHEELLMPRRLIRAASQIWEAQAPSMPKATPKAAVVEEEATQTAAPVFAKPQAQENGTATPPEPRAITPAPAEDSPSPAKTTLPSEATRPWTAAMGDLRNLIQKRGTEPKPTIAEDPAKDAPTASSPPTTQDTQPIISDAFKNFMGMGKATPPSQENRSSGEGAPAIQPNGQRVATKTAAPPQAASPPVDHAQALSPAAIQLRLRQLKHERMGDAGTLPLDRDRIKRLIHLAGQRFPAISQEIAGTNASECQWRFQQSEVHFSFHPHQDTAYWRTRLAEVAQRAQELRESARTRVKLAVFARRGEEANFDDWTSGEDAATHLQFCDLILLSDAQIAAINAVDQVLNETPVPSRPVVFSQVSGELDFLWKMITRPVWTLIDPRDRHAS